jgi:dTDP-4-dehydrorhamnose reductase
VNYTERRGGGLAVRIAITGASGLLGNALVLEAQRRGYGVIGFYHSVSLGNPGIDAKRLDIRDTDGARDALSTAGPDVVLHAAAETRVDWCENHPDEAGEVNIEASGNLARIAAQLGCGFVYISTDSVFDGSRGDYKETDIALPVNVYARTKLKGEEAVLRALPQSLVVRTNFYGRGTQHHRQGLLEWILHELRAGRSMPGFTDVIFSPLYVDDAARLSFDLIERKASGIFHVAGSEATSKYEFARNVAFAFGYDPAAVEGVPLSGRPMRARRPLNTSLNTEKIRYLLGFSTPNLLEGLMAVAKPSVATGAAQERLRAAEKKWTR